MSLLFCYFHTHPSLRLFDRNSFPYPIISNLKIMVFAILDPGWFSFCNIYSITILDLPIQIQINNNISLFHLFSESNVKMANEWKWLKLIFFKLISSYKSRKLTYVMSLLLHIILYLISIRFYIFGMLAT